MKNHDKLTEKKIELRNALAEAVRANDETQIGNAMENWMQFVTETVMDEANGLLDATDRTILAARGIRQLTAEETKFYEGFIAAARQDAQTVITNITGALPQTVVDDVMEDMKQAYPLLNMIDFTNTGAAVKWVLNAQGEQAATWGDLNTSITKDLEGAIKIIDLTQKKLSAYMFATQDMLALGPAWVDRYVRAILADSISAGLEVGVVDGNGKNAPIGMTRDFEGSFDPADGFARKNAVAITTLDPTTYGSMLSTLATDGNTGRQRTIPRVLFIVNPADYFLRVMPATTLLSPEGKYVNGVVPYPTDFVQSVGVPSGHAILGIAKKYFMAVGTGTGGKLEKSDDFKFLDDLRTYKIKFYGNGMPKDINAFLYLDITNLVPVYPTINNVNP